jgi:hypothetical protein
LLDNLSGGSLSGGVASFLSPFTDLYLWSQIALTNREPL